MNYRLTTARRLKRFCPHCKLTLHRRGDINQDTGIPELNFWYLDGANRERCLRCNNRVVLK